MPSLSRVLLPLFLGALLLVAGCRRGEHAAQVKELSPSELKALGQVPGMAVLDVNGDDFRRKNGIITGARLLSSSAKYDTSELPGEKEAKLVFYCSNRF